MSEGKGGTSNTPISFSPPALTSLSIWQSLKHTFAGCAHGGLNPLYEANWFVSPSCQSQSGAPASAQLRRLCSSLACAGTSEQEAARQVESVLLM